MSKSGEMTKCEPSRNMGLYKPSWRSKKSYQILAFTYVHRMILKKTEIIANLRKQVIKDFFHFIFIYFFIWKRLWIDEHSPRQNFFALLKLSLMWIEVNPFSKSRQIIFINSIHY